MGGTAYAATSLGPHTVGTRELKDHAVTVAKIHSRAVTSSKVGPNSIRGSKVAANSLSLADLVGADAKGTIGFTLPGNSCGTLNIAVSGAQVGQVVLFSYTGNTAVPSSVMFGGTRVTGAGMVNVHACNDGSAIVTVSNLGIRIVTFG